MQSEVPQWVPAVRHYWRPPHGVISRTRDTGDALQSAARRGVLTLDPLLGVTLYLSRETNLATFRAIATATAPGDELVFTYVD